MRVKRVLRPDRLRRGPPQFSWIDQRGVRGRHLERWDAHRIAPYLVFVTGAEGRGLSYYGEASLARLLSMPAARLIQARADLIRLDLIAYERPLYQVLSLDPPLSPRIHGVHPIERGLAQLRATLAAHDDRDRRG